MILFCRHPFNYIIAIQIYSPVGNLQFWPNSAIFIRQIDLSSLRNSENIDNSMLSSTQLQNKKQNKSKITISNQTFFEEFSSQTQPDLSLPIHSKPKPKSMRWSYGYIMGTFLKQLYNLFDDPFLLLFTQYYIIKPKIHLKLLSRILLIWIARA